MTRAQDEAERRTNHINRVAGWSSWFRNSFGRTLARAAQALEEHGSSPEKLTKELAKNEPRPWTPQTFSKVRKNTQKAAYNLLNNRPAGWGVQRIRNNLNTWALPHGQPRQNAEAAAANLMHMGKLVPPRVHAASMSTIFGRWLTRRRMGRHGPCRFGCDRGPCDIRHYVSCQVLRDFIRNNLGVHLRADEALGAFTLTQRPVEHAHDKDWLPRIGMATYVAYRGFNCCRANGAGVHGDELRRMMVQLAYEASRDTPKLIEIITEARLRAGGAARRGRGARVICTLSEVVLK